MQTIYEQKFLKQVKTINKSNCIILSGNEACATDLLLVLESLNLNVALNDFFVIIFYYRFNKNTLSIFESLYPETCLVNIEEINSASSLLNHTSHLSREYYSPALFIRFYGINLLNHFETVILLDRDTYVLKDFTRELGHLKKRGSDIIAWDYCGTDEAEKEGNQMTEYTFGILSDYHQLHYGKKLIFDKVKKINNGVIFFFKSLLQKVTPEIILHEMENISIFQTNYSNNNLYFSDEDILTYLINILPLQYSNLPRSLNFIPSFISAHPCSSEVVSATSEQNNDLYILHMLGSDKRSPFISSVFPEIETGTRSLYLKLQSLSLDCDSGQLEKMQNLLSNSVSLSYNNRILHLLNLRLFLFYKEYSFDIFNYLKTSNNLYTEKLQSDSVFLIFIKNTPQSTRFIFSPMMFKLDLIEITFRIFYEPYFPSFKRGLYVNEFKQSNFFKSYQNLFYGTKLTYDNRFIFLKTTIPQRTLLKSLKKIDVLFEMHAEEMYGKFL